MSNVKAKVLAGFLAVGLLLSGCQSTAPVTTLAPTAAPTRTHTATAESLPAPTPVATPSTEPTSPTATATVPAIVADLAGLDIDAFFDASYKKLVLRSPEAVTHLGLAEAWGTANDQLDDLSDKYRRETQALEVAVLDLLQSYDRAALTPAQQRSYDVYVWYLEDQVRGHAFMYNDYPLNPFIISYHNGLIHLFTQIQPVTDQESAQAYIARLAQVERQTEQVVDGLRRREESGVVLPLFANRWIHREISGIARSSARGTPFYTAFRDKVNALSELSAEDRAQLLEEAEGAIERSVQPGFAALAGFLEQQQRVATNEVGVWTFPNGEDYYAYTLHHHTTSNLTADEIHALGHQELARIHGEMRAVFDTLGYPEDAGLPALYRRVTEESGTLRGAAIVAEYEALIEAAQRDMRPAFARLPKAEVIVIGGPTGGYYVGPALDGSRPGAFYARNTGSEPRYKMASLAYHESVPGHHLQIALAQELDLPLFRNDIGFTGYAEGWALYAERLAWELGFYEDDPYGNLGRLQYEAFRAARLVVDTGIHAQRWTFDQAVDFMMENTGMSREGMVYEVTRYICWPGQATSYKIGMLKLLELRQRAMDALGDDFDLASFHDAVLGSGSLPLDLLERRVQDSIEAGGDG